MAKMSDFPNFKVLIQPQKHFFSTLPTEWDSESSKILENHTHDPGRKSVLHSVMCHKRFITMFGVGIFICCFWNLTLQFPSNSHSTPPPKNSQISYFLDAVAYTIGAGLEKIQYLVTCSSKNSEISRGVRKTIVQIGVVNFRFLSHPEESLLLPLRLSRVISTVH